jgi:hypothetical protein
MASDFDVGKSHIGDYFLLVAVSGMTIDAWLAGSTRVETAPVLSGLSDTGARNAAGQ